MAEAAEKQEWLGYDEASAEWVLEQITKLDIEEQTIRSQHRKMIERYNRWLDAQLSEINNSKLRLQEKLKPWMDEQLAGSRKKSVTLPSGRIGYGQSKEVWSLNGVVADANNEALLNFVKNGHSEFIKHTETVKWGDFKKTLRVTETGTVCTKDGEIIEGMEVVKQPPEMYVKLTGEPIATSVEGE